MPVIFDYHKMLFLITSLWLVSGSLCDDYIHSPIQYHSQTDRGAYNYGYDTGLYGSHQFHQENKDESGQVRGRYGYTDPYGKLRLVHYTSGPQGFQVVSDTEDYKRLTSDGVITNVIEKYTTVPQLVAKATHTFPSKVALIPPQPLPSQLIISEEPQQIIEQSISQEPLSQVIDEQVVVSKPLAPVKTVVFPSPSRALLPPSKVFIPPSKFIPPPLPFAPIAQQVISQEPLPQQIIDEQVLIPETPLPSVKTLIPPPSPKLFIPPSKVLIPPSKVVIPPPLLPPPPPPPAKTIITQEPVSQQLIEEQVIIPQQPLPPLKTVIPPPSPKLLIPPSKAIIAPHLPPPHVHTVVHTVSQEAIPQQIEEHVVIPPQPLSPIKTVIPPPSPPVIIPPSKVLLPPSKAVIHPPLPPPVAQTIITQEPIPQQIEEPLPPVQEIVALSPPTKVVIPPHKAVISVPAIKHAVISPQLVVSKPFKRIHSGLNSNVKTYMAGIDYGIPVVSPHAVPHVARPAIVVLPPTAIQSPISRLRSAFIARSVRNVSPNSRE